MDCGDKRERERRRERVCVCVCGVRHGMLQGKAMSIQGVVHMERMHVHTRFSHAAPFKESKYP